MERNDYREAYRNYLIVVQKDPGNEEALEAIGRLQAILTSQARGEAAALAGNPPGAFAPKLRSAIKVLSEAAQYDPNGTLLGPDKTRYEALLSEIERDNEARCQGVPASLASERFTDARANIDRIRGSDPNFEQLLDLEGKYEAALERFLSREVVRLLDEKEFARARSTFAQLQALSLSGPELAQLEETIETKESAWLEQELRANMSDRRYYTAYLNIRNNPRGADFSDTLATARKQGAAFYLAQGRRRLEEGDLGRAYLEAVKGFELDESLPGIFEFHRDTRDQVLQRIQKYIAVPTFGAPRDDPDVGAQFSDALISYLFRILPYGINIVEREKIDLLLEEHKRELAEVGRLFDVDLVVTGNVSLLSVEQQDTQQQSTIQAKVGEKKELNPAYEAYTRANPKPETPPPPQLISVPQYDKITYAKGKATLKGFATVSVRIFDVHKGSISYAQEFNANFQASDEFQDAVEMAGVEADPLDLPTHTEVKEKLREKIITPLAKVIRDQFGQRATEYLRQANYHLSRREEEKAMDQLAQGFLYCTKAKIDPGDPDFASLREVVIQKTEQNFLPEPEEE